MKVYIAGPIAGHHDLNRQAFADAAAYFRGRGDEVVDPHEVAPHHHDGPCPERGYFPGHHESGHTSSCCFMRTDMAAMLTCDAIYLLRGWEHSRGARDEFNAAAAAGLRIIFEGYGRDSLTTLQDDVQQWVVRNFGTDNELATVVGLVEEVGEMCRAVVKRSQGIRGSEEEWTAELRKESADVLIKLCDIAQFNGFSLAEAVAERWGKVRQRDWRADPQGHGIGGES